MDRQDEQLLIQAINELAHGRALPDTVGFLKSLNGHLPIASSEKRVLFALNDYVTIYNKMQINEMNGKVFMYQSKDEGTKDALDGIKIEKVIFTMLYQM